jgi:hypothetical protein
MGTSQPTNHIPAYVWEVEINASHGVTLIDPVKEIASGAPSHTHLSLDKDCPDPCPVMPPGSGRVVGIPQVNSHDARLYRGCVKLGRMRLEPSHSVIYVGK